MVYVDVNDRQQVPPHLIFALPRVKVEDKSKLGYNILKYTANIKSIPNHSLHRWDMWR